MNNPKLFELASDTLNILVNLYKRKIYLIEHGDFDYELPEINEQMKDLAACLKLITKAIDNG